RAAFSRQYPSDIYNYGGYSSQHFYGDAHAHHHALYTNSQMDYQRRARSGATPSFSSPGSGGAGGAVPAADTSKHFLSTKEPERPCASPAKSKDDSDKVSKRREKTLVDDELTGHKTCSVAKPTASSLLDAEP
ncbi:unnamed protein product, partial [Lymnaea stagnalis]